VKQNSKADEPNTATTQQRCTR